MEGRHRLAHSGLLLHLRHGPGGGLQLTLQGFGLSLAQQLHGAAGLEGAGALIKVGPASNPLPLEMGELGLKADASPVSYTHLTLPTKRIV